MTPDIFVPWTRVALFLGYRLPVQSTIDEDFAVSFRTEKRRRWEGSEGREEREE